MPVLAVPHDVGGFGTIDVTSGNVVINGNTVEVTGNDVVVGAATGAINVTLTSTGNVAMNGDVNINGSLTVITAANGLISLNSVLLSSSNAMKFDGPVAVATDITINTASNNANASITFTSTITATRSSLFGLVIDAGGAIAFGDAVGTFSTVTVNANTGSVFASGIITNTAGNLVISAGDVIQHGATGGSISVVGGGGGGGVTLSTGGVAVGGSGGGVIAFSNTDTIVGEALLVTSLVRNDPLGSRLGNLTVGQMGQFVQEVNQGARTPNVTANIVVDSVGAFSRTLTNYLAARRSGLPVLALGDKMSSYRARPSGSPMLASAAANSEALAYAVSALLGQPDEEADKILAEMADKDWSFFAKVYGIYSDQDTTSGRTGYQSYGTGFQVGADHQINERWLAGILGGYGRTNTKINSGLGEIDTDSFRMGAFASYNHASWFGDASVTYGLHTYEADRTTTAAGTVNADYQGHDVTAYLGGGYDITQGNWGFTPTASLRYTYFRQNGYRERGLGALNFQARDTQTLYSRLGAKITYLMHHANTTLVPEILFGWEHEYLGDNPNIKASFTGGNTFNIDTSSPERDSAFFGAGLTAIWSERCTTYARYEGAANSTGKIHSITGGIRFTF